MKNPLALGIKNRGLLRLVESVTKIGFLRDLYDQWLASSTTIINTDTNQGALFIDFVLARLGVSLDIQNQVNLAAIPRQGPLIIVANHPLGGLEGMLLSQLLLTIRPDLKVLANDLLLKFPEFDSLFIGVDVLGSNKAQHNSQGIRAVARHLAAQGAILIFPAGTVSTLTLSNLTIADPLWHPMIGQLALKYQAACLPIYVDGRNPLSFYWSGLIHKRLRTALLPRAMVAKSGCQISAYIGETLLPTDLRQFDSAVQLRDYLRLCSELLVQDQNRRAIPLHTEQQMRRPVEKSLIIEQHNQLSQYCLLDQAPFKVFCAPYHKLGCIMEQIAIYREETFRAVDEGTGNELDSDHFDPYYWHLWLWDEQAGEIAGGYRLGFADQIAKEFGIEKLYSRSLYRYNQQFIKEFTGSVEAGRSFVCPAYQRHPKVLDLLWRGIGAFMTLHPQYHTLFGCVSISQQYSLLARAFLADTLLKNFAAEPRLLQNVKPTFPFDLNSKPWSDRVVSEFAEIPIINKLLGRIDGGKSIPILIRHYLALKGRFISFTVNKDFNHSLDGLLIVDLRQTPAKYIKRYLGKEGEKAFNARWKSYEAAA